MENSHKQCEETGHPVVNNVENKWRLGQKHDQNFPVEEGTPL